MYFVARMVKLTVQATNLNFLELNASAGPKVLISLLNGYVEGHMTLDDFSCTDPLMDTYFFQDCNEVNEDFFFIGYFFQGN